MVPPATSTFNSPSLNIPFGDTVQFDGAIPFSDEVAQFEAEQHEAFGDHAATIGALKRTARKTMTPDLIGRCALMIADLIATAAALFAVIILSEHISTTFPDCVAVLLIIPVCKLLGLYDRDTDVLHKTTFIEAPRLFCAALVVTMVAITLRNGLTGSGQQIYTNQLAFMSFALFSAMCFARITARRLVRTTTSQERILMIGTARDYKRLSHALASTPALDASIVEHLSTEEQTGLNGLPRAIDAPDKLELELKSMDIDRVVIATGSRPGQFDSLIRGITATGTKVSLQPQLSPTTRAVPVIEEVGAVKLVNVRQPRFSPAAQRTKRAIDFCGATLGVVLISPLLALIAGAIKLDSRGPVLYRQKRIGLDGKEFEILKFRTMRINADVEKQRMLHMNETDGLFKMTSDPRVTRVGKFLRKTSIDELPQLINVIRGEMSLVGPRPLVPEEDRKVTGWRRYRSTITPGMTGVWQLLGPVRIPMDEMVELDYEYVANWSLATDIKILLQTVPHVLGSRGL
jgi:exopolysaccharide biosynthesis polyprenyl glycosylphosphotransferase